jgi:hypothetical protein
MGKKKDNVLGTCALCKTENVELRESHLIPKLVYKRMKSMPNTRFRNLYQIKDIYQDGEKMPMLCHDCEQFFNKFETPYTNKILEPYLNEKPQKRLSDDIVNNFINSMSWRILYDDLYNRQSFEGMDCRRVFESMEQDLCNHLDSIRIGKSESGSIGNIKNHVYRIDEFKYRLPVKKLFAPMAFGYSKVDRFGNYYIITSFLGLVFVTEYKPSIYIDGGGVITNFVNSFKPSNIKARVKEELLEYAHMAAKQAMENEKELDSGLREKLIKRYNKSK